MPQHQKISGLPYRLNYQCQLFSVMNGTLACLLCQMLCALCTKRLFKAKVKSWEGKLLSRRGKEVLIRLSVWPAQAGPEILGAHSELLKRDPCVLRHYNTLYIHIGFF